MQNINRRLERDELREARRDRRVRSTRHGSPLGPRPRRSRSPLMEYSSSEDIRSSPPVANQRRLRD
jgi:hypothetical protein